MKALNWLLLLIGIAVVVSLFVLFAPQQTTTLHFVNMAVAIAITAVAIVGVAWHRNGVQQLATTLQIVSFSFYTAIWMVVYNLLLVDKIDILWYYAGLIIIAAIFAFVVILVIQGGSHQHGVNCQCKESVAEKQTIDTDLRTRESELLQIMSDEQTYKSAAKVLSIVVEKLDAMPLHILETNKGLQTQVNTMVQTIDLVILQLQSAQITKQQGVQHVEQVAKQTIMYINTVKNQ